MAQSDKTLGYRGSYFFGVLLLLVVIIRSIILYFSQTNLIPALAALAAFALFYISEPLLSQKQRWSWMAYFTLQTALILILSIHRPYLDLNGTLFILLSVQAVRSLPRRAALIWNVLFIVLLTITMIVGTGVIFGLVISMLIIAIGIFMVSYDALYIQAQTDQADSEVLLEKLWDAHQKLQEFTKEAEELVAASERNRLVHELHDSVSQTVFSATLTARSAQLLLEKNPAQTPEQLQRLQEMTSTALSQLRALITQMRPQQ
jgi:signal transduction histidine kinase